MQNDWVGLYDAALHYYMHLDASQLTDDEWCAMIARLSFIRKQESEGK